MIKFENVFLKYHSHFDTLHNFSFDFKNGHKYLLIGDKDAGANSLLRIAVGIEKPSSGNIFVDNKILNASVFSNKINLGYLSEINPFLNNKTVKQNLQHVLKIRDYADDQINKIVDLTINEFDLSDIENLKVNKLSDFNKILLSIARLWMRDLDVLLIEDIFNSDLSYHKGYSNLKMHKGKHLHGFSDNEKTILQKAIVKLIEKNKKATMLVAVGEQRVCAFDDFEVLHLKFGVLQELENGE